MVNKPCLIVVVVSAYALATAQPGATSVAQSSEPTTRPNRPFFDRRDGQMQRQWRERLGSFDPAAAGTELTPQEIEEVTRFMTAHSPRRMERLEDVPDSRRLTILRRIHAQYSMLQRMKEEDRQIYELRLKRLPIEDEMFDLGWRLKPWEDNDAKEVEQLRKRLGEQVRLFYENSLEERRIRLERAMQRLKQEQEQYDRLVSEKDARVQRGIEDIENERGDALKDLVGPIWPQAHRPRERERDRERGDDPSR